eukprot:NODE_9143_length_660_cov_132.327747_g8879_i0.p1 GENE.NODE_9143_length_660_cov_132.327747_g8879_i0~~NODE_9143_length_660_cov_132.327747_g8879_i0.p1  ORF type:complete len:171 (-),score=35.75 NODE_9143_length_660_cov_132.327747_g8879_i0:148-591(-)
MADLNTPVTIHHIARLQLTRRAMEAWLKDDEIEEIVKGCYVRVLVDKEKGCEGSAKVYRLSEVVGLTTDAEYKLSDGGKTSTYLTLQYGDQISTCKIDHISNSQISLPEFEAWQSMMAHCGIPALSVYDVIYKLRKTKTYIRLCLEE